MNLKIDLKAINDMNIFLKLSCIQKRVKLRKSTIAEKESQNRNSDAAFGRVFRVVSVLAEATKKFIFIFLFKKIIDAPIGKY